MAFGRQEACLIWDSWNGPATDGAEQVWIMVEEKERSDRSGFTTSLIYVFRCKNLIFVRHNSRNLILVLRESVPGEALHSSHEACRFMILLLTYLYNCHSWLSLTLAADVVMPSSHI